MPNDKWRPRYERTQDLLQARRLRSRRAAPLPRRRRYRLARYSHVYFVRSNAKVRDLFESMYRGFPVGYLLFWENAQANSAKQIGIGSKQHTVPSRLIVDGQQRLTALYAVFRGKRVLDDDYRERQIEVAFRPRDGRFEVADAAIHRDPEWISNISELWASGKSSYQMVKGFLRSLQEKTILTEEEEEHISHNLDRLFDLQKYPFTALEIASSVDEEQVADIFVRINSEGVKLNQADFILTLLSVFWDKGRAELESFCRASRQPPAPGSQASPFNHFIEPDPDQLLRVSVALGFEPDLATAKACSRSPTATRNSGGLSKTASFRSQFCFLFSAS